MKVPTLLLPFTLLTIGVESVVALAGSASLNPAKMLCLVNEFRVKNGRSPIGLNGSLNVAAQRHSILQAKHKALSHRLPGEPDLAERVRAVGVPYHGISENAHQGSRTEEGAIRGWINSPLYRANMLSDITHGGFGMAMADNGEPYWTQVFIKNTSLRKTMPICRGMNRGNYIRNN
ncbi:hypothetical protein BDF22DRAFT_686800 [Syncephalis plumigaleata]|nr:hypothetical protein BDF22DRAFT_686800 [Syncephalis plumigaleata]